MSNDLEAELTHRVMVLAGRTRAVFGGVGLHADTPSYLAKKYVRQLESENLTEAAETAREIISGLVDWTEMDGWDFWRGPLGQRLMTIVGYHKPAVRRADIAHMVGVSRQAILVAIEAGHLVRGEPDSLGFMTITRESFASWMRARAAR